MKRNMKIIVLYYVGHLAFSEAYLIYMQFPKVGLIQCSRVGTQLSQLMLKIKELSQICQYNEDDV
jgi:hypothetical protein